MERAHIVPVDGKLVPDPDHGGHLPKEGIDVDFPLSTYWYRREKDGDVTVVKGGKGSVPTGTSAKTTQH